MGTPAEKEYTAFEEKVKRTVYIDNLSPQVTDAVLKTALGQFGNVTNVQFIPNYMELNNIPQCALVEMENAKQAKSIVNEMSNYPFMMSGMPRPVRARAAEIAMFGDRPIKPGRKITCRWVDRADPDFEVAQKLKDLTRKHALEAAYLLKLQLDEEKNLAQLQSDALKANYKKYEMLENLLQDGTFAKLTNRYNLPDLEDH